MRNVVKTVAFSTFSLMMCAPLAAAGKKSGDYTTLYANEMTTLNYLITSTTSEHMTIANMIDGLVEFNRFGILQPSLAKSWTQSPDGLVYTFKLREGVPWVTSDGKVYGEVVAQDFVDGAKYVLTKSNASKVSDIVTSVVKNAQKYYDGQTTNFADVGVKAKDKYTVEYTLSEPVPYFLSMLTYVCFFPVNGKFLAEAGKRFGTDNKTLLYNGAYRMTTFEPQSYRELVKNDKYLDASSVYINKLKYRYNKETSTLGPELFLRDEISGLADPLPASMVDSWMKDPAKKSKLHPAMLDTYTYFYAFNFNPKFDAQYDPATWKIIVNNKAFRKSIFYALNRKAALSTIEPFHPERLVNTTLTPRNFVSAGGKDYVDMPALKAFSHSDFFNPAKAVVYEKQAIKELSGKVKFPVKIYMPYNVGHADWANRAQIVEQQLENALGKNYIDIIPAPYPATGFLDTTRRRGNYAIQECTWGPDYADPATYTDPFFSGGTYNKPELAVGYADANGKPHYDNLVTAAKAETQNLKTRYELFSKAEAFLIEEAFVVPYAAGGGGYEASKLDSFTNSFAPFGVSIYKFKGRTVLDHPIPSEAYAKLEAAWQKQKNSAVAKSR